MSHWTDADRAEARKAAEALMAKGDHPRNPAAPGLVGTFRSGRVAPRKWAYQDPKTKVIPTDMRRIVPSGDAGVVPAPMHLSPEMRAAIDSLPERQREVVWASLVLCGSATKLAEALGVSADTVRRDRDRALEAIRRLLTGRPQDTRPCRCGAAIPKPARGPWPQRCKACRAEGDRVRHRKAA